MSLIRVLEGVCKQHLSQTQRAKYAGWPIGARPLSAKRILLGIPAVDPRFCSLDVPYRAASTREMTLGTQAQNVWGRSSISCITRAAGTQRTSLVSVGSGRTSPS